MKKVALKILILCMAICSALCVFTACGGGTNIELSFVVDNEVVQTIKTTGSELIEIPDDPEKIGYTFDGWYWDKGTWETPFTANSLLNAPISKNMSIYAKFKAIEYTATFVADEEQVGTAKFTIEDTEIANIPQVPEKVGYTGVWEEYTIKTEDITINAVYTINKYTVIWQNEDGTVLKTDENVEHGTVLEYDGETPQKTADAQYTYTFDKWQPVVSEITGDITYTATYSTTVNKYTVVWKNYDGTVLETDENVPYGQMPEYNGTAPEKIGNQQYSYRFDNVWSPAVDSVKGNAEYIAQFNSVVNKYTISFYDDDKTTVLGTATVDYGTNATYPNTTPLKNQDNGYTYTFDKWVKADNTADNLQNVTDNRDVYAKYTATPRVYNVYFVENGGSDINNTTYTYSVGLSVLPDENYISKTGYTFEGWKNAQGNAVTAISTESYGDITLYAQWQTITYYASFYADDMLVDTKPFTVEDTAIANIPSVPEKTGYTGEWEDYSILAENITINADYAPIECTITYVDVKTATNNNQTKYNIESAKITLADLDNIDGYNFNCWLDEDGNKITEIPAGSFGYREITAKWDLVEFDISYTNLKTATNNNQTKYNIESAKITLIDLDDIDGYDFNCWLDEKGNKITEITSGSFGNREITAKWDIVEFNIVYANVKMAANNNLTKYTIESIKITLINLDNIDGYNFNCWLDEDGNKITEIPVGSFGHREITAKWDLVEFDISYTNLKAASNGNKVKYTIESAKITLADLDNIDGYDFNCWLDEDGNKITEIPAGSFGNREITAKWDIIEFNIVYTNIKTAVNNNITKYTIESDTITLINLDDIDGYNFNCWLDKNGNKTTEIPAGSLENREITAKWDIVEFTIDYVNVKSAINNNVTKYTIESAKITLVNLDNIDGYNFNCWLDKNGNKTTEIPAGSLENREITAKWDIVEFTIDYVNVKSAINNNVTKYTIESAKITLADLDNIDGYNFNCWLDEDGNKITEILAGSFGNREITAKWDLVEFDLILNYEAERGDYAIGTSNPNKYTIESDITLTELVCNNTGYIFVGWFTEKNNGTGVKVEKIKDRIGTISLYAQWDLENYSITYYGVNNAVNTNLSNYTVETETFTIDNLSRTGYTFDGWFNSDDTVANTTITKGSIGNKAFYAKWTAIEYDIDYVLYDGTYVGDENPANYTIESSIVFNGLTKDGYRFDGWFDAAQGGNKLTGISVGTYGNKTVYAHWTYISTITYNSNGGSAVSPTINPAGTVITAPVVPTKDYYEFVGWYDEPLINKYLFNTQPSKDITLYAKWEPVKYNIIYVLNGGNNGNNPAQYTLEQKVELKDASKTGYTFVGWFTDELFTSVKVEEISLGSHGEIVLYANYSINQYTISFETNGGTTIADITQNYATTVNAPSDPAKNGYTFSGWYSDSALKNAYTFTTMPADNITVYAKWTLVNYGITYNLNGGTNGNNPAKYTITSSDITLKNPTKTGYEFKGWFTDSNYQNAITVIANGSYGDIELFAKWEIITYTVTYVLPDGATHTNPTSYTIETATISLTDAEKTGYTFVGWFDAATNGNSVTIFAGGTIGNLTIYGRFTVNDYTVWLDGSEEATYTVEFNLNGKAGTAPMTQTITESNMLKYPTVPTCDGYVFAGWFDNEDCKDNAFDFTAVVNNNTVLYAKWIAIEDNNVISVNGTATVTLNGANDITYMFVPLTSGNVTITTTGSYDTFGVLYNDQGVKLVQDDDTGTDSNLQIIYNVTANKAYYIKVRAYSSAITGTCTLYLSGNNTVADGGYTVTSSKTTVTFDADFTLAVPEARDGYKFLGWEDANGVLYTDGTGASVKTWDKAETAVLYSKWERTVYTINFVTNGGSAVESVTFAFGDRIDLNDYVTTLANKSFLGWYASNTDTERYNATYMPDHNLTLYAKWTNYALGEIKYNSDKVAIKETDELTAELFGAVCLDTDGNFATINVTLSGTQVAGETVSIRLVATNNGKTKQKTVSGIKVYGIPTLTFDNTVDYVNLKDGLTPEWFNAVGTDSFGENTEIRFEAIIRVYNGITDIGRQLGFGSSGTYYLPAESFGMFGGEYIKVHIYAVNAAGNTLRGTTKDLRVYDLPVITYNEGKTAISINDTINAELFNATAKDSFGEDLTVSVMIYDGTISAGNTVTIRLTATDSKGNAQIIDRQVKVYGMPTIDNATKLDFKVEDEITVNSLELTAKDTYNNPLEIALTVKSGTQTAGSTIVFTATATDVAGNVTTKDISVRIYGTPTITYNRAGIKSTENPTSNANLLNTVAKDSFDGGLTVTVTLKSGTVKGGEYVVYTLTAIDKVGNIATVDTAPIPVYEINDIKFTDNVNYFSGATDAIKLDSKGEEFYANITDTFGGLCDITIEPAVGYTLKAGNTINLYLVATDKAGNSVKSGLISGIKIYGTPTYVMNQDVVYEDTDLEFLFTVYDSFGEELYYEVSVIGEQIIGNTVQVHIFAEDDYGNKLDSIMDIYIVPDGFVYKLNSTKTAYMLVSYTGNELEVEIPSSITNIPVTIIQEQAFADRILLQKVIIPDSVTSIGYGIFSGCSSLASITIPFVGAALNGTENTHFGYVFGADFYLDTSSYVPSSLKTVVVRGGNSIGNYTFYNCSSLTSITIGNNVNCIGSSAFRGCSSLTSITIPDSVTSIGEYAFYNCNSLKSITIPDSVMSIGRAAFSACSKLESLTIPFVGESRKTASNSYQYPFGYIFGTNSYTGSTPTDQLYHSYTSTTYTTYYIPLSLKTVKVMGGNILSGAFYNCSSLTSITIGNNVNCIGSSAFRGCSSLTSITIPDSVTSIGEYAFLDCSSLTSITIPDNVTSIGEYAFYNCNSLISITIPDSVTSIGHDAFRECSSLTSITIGYNVTYIALNAFQHCSKVTSVTFKNTNGWKIYNSSSSTSGRTVTVTSTSVAATYLTTTYYNYVWKRG